MADCEPRLGLELLQTERQHWVGDGTPLPIVPSREMCVVPTGPTL